MLVTKPYSRKTYKQNLLLECYFFKWLVLLEVN